MWKKIRVTTLLIVLCLVSSETYLKQLEATDWIEPLRAVVHPINGDGRASTQAYIDSLGEAQFDEVERFMKRQARGYHLPVDEPVQVVLGGQLDEAPPAPPRDGGVLHAIGYSLGMRYWSLRHDREPGDIRMYLVLFDPEHTDRLPNSVALSKGMLGLVYGSADHEYDGSNNFVLTHEMLHTLGATDKYDPATNYPLYPVGFAEPWVAKRLPQRKAEIMGGRIPFDEHNAYMPYSLDEAVIGGYTAAEIKWIR